MVNGDLREATASLIEAVLDIDCDLPPAIRVESLEGAAKECFQEKYPDIKPRYLLEHEFEARIGSPTETTTRQNIDGYLFRSADNCTIVQVRSRGFSFNRLAPYTTLDDYLPEIERCWKLFVKISTPVQLRVVRLRYINRIQIPLVNGAVRLDEYFEVCPRLPDDQLSFVRFLNQHVAVEVETGNEVTTTLASKEPTDNKLPIVFDITTGNSVQAQPDDWAGIRNRIQSLRSLKNRVFEKTVTQKCRALFP